MSTRSIAAVLFVLFAYLFFSSGGELEYRRVPWTDSYYASLAEGFLRGQVSMAHDPPPELLALADPYVFANREGILYAWDASLYKGRYYLYFSPLPALLFTIPFRLVANGYPPDSLAATFFCIWAFLAAVAFLRRALKSGGQAILPVRTSPLSRTQGTDCTDTTDRADCTSSTATTDGQDCLSSTATSDRQDCLSSIWILLVGVGTLVPYLLTDVRVYEVAIACATSMTMTRAYTLLCFLERPSMRSAFLMGLFLGLTIGARPNLIVLLLVAFIAMIRTPRFMVAAAIPLIATGRSYAAYNYARFESPGSTGAMARSGSVTRGVRRTRGAAARTFCAAARVPGATAFR